MTKAAPAKDARRVAMRRMAKTYLAPHWPGLALCLALAVAVALVYAGIMWLIQQAIDQLLVEKVAAALVWIPLAIVALGLGRGALLALQLIVINRIGHTVVGAIQLDLFSRLVGADLARLKSVHSGSHVSSMMYDAGLVRDGATTVAVSYVQNALITIAMVGFMASVDIGLTAIALTTTPFVFLFVKRYEKRAHRATVGAMGESSNLSTVILEGLDGVKVVKIEGREAYERERVAAVVKRRQDHLIRGSNAKALSGPVVEMVMVWLIAAILAYCGWRARHGAFDAADFSAFMFALIQASQSFRALSGLQPAMGEAGAAANRLIETLDIVPTIVDAPNAKPLKDGPSTIAFEDVTFAYGEDVPAVSDVALQVRRGETIALVGPSGGGKSTVLNLIPRFFDVTSGRVTIDGQDVREVTIASLRARIALVTQEPFLFDDTIRANIAYARPGATDAQIEAAARQAAAHEFIMATPKGYDTSVGEAGVRLSGGQRQRIAIARAFLKDAPILLLDEATSALDTESEAQVQAALERLMHGRTTLLIAHRLSTVRHATRILVLEAGRIVESGTHAQLVKKGGLYARLARSQHLDAAEAGA